MLFRSFPFSLHLFYETTATSNEKFAVHPSQVIVRIVVRSTIKRILGIATVLGLKILSSSAEGECFSLVTLQHCNTLFWPAVSSETTTNQISYLSDRFTVGLMPLDNLS